MKSYFLRRSDREEWPYSEDQISAAFCRWLADRNTPCRLGTDSAWKTIDDYLPMLKYDTQLPADLPNGPAGRFAGLNGILPSACDGTLRRRAAAHAANRFPPRCAREYRSAVCFDSQAQCSSGRAPFTPFAVSGPFSRSQAPAWERTCLRSFALSNKSGRGGRSTVAFAQPDDPA